ncbi:MAG: FtsX-like permease family protein, partial [Candidatus Micrarchaeota archaeon]
GGSDNTILMPIVQARAVLEGFTVDQFSTIYVKASNLEEITQTVSDLEQTLLYSRHLVDKNKDFTVTASQAMQEQVQSMTASISLFLGGIAAISLLVGAIGIANTMFMAVLERTKQIGLLKALGTKNSEVTRLFLMESAFLGFAGGLIGCILSLAISFLLAELGVGLSLPTGGRGRSGIAIVTPELILFALLFSTLIGMAAGFIPAKQAAKLQPIEALRYE